MNHNPHIAISIWNIIKNISSKNLLGALVIAATLFLSTQTFAENNSSGNTTSSTKESSYTKQPDLADIIPLSATLSGRLATLELSRENKLDISGIENKLADIKSKLETYTSRLGQLRDSKSQNYDEFIELRLSIGREHSLLTDLSSDIDNEVNELGLLRTGWVKEKKDWKDWHSIFIEEEEFNELKPTFTDVNNTIEAALDLIQPRLKVLLNLQRQSGQILETIISLNLKIGNSINTAKRSIVLDSFPPMFSSQYFSQFGGELWHATISGLYDFISSDTRLSSQEEWFFYLQIFLTIFSIIIIYRNRQFLRKSDRWKCLASRPISSGLFIGLIATIWLYKYEGISPIWTLSLEMIGGLSLMRLLGALVTTPWKQHFIYSSLSIWIIGRILYFSDIPVPLSRLYIVITASLGAFFFLLWAKQSKLEKKATILTRLLHLGFLFLFFVVVAGLIGKEGLAGHFYMSFLRSIVQILAFVLLVNMIQGSLQYLFYLSPLKKAEKLQRKAGVLIQRITFILASVLVVFLLLPGILVIWGAMDTFKEACSAILTFGFNIGEQKINVSLALTVMYILYCAHLISWILQEFIVAGEILGSTVETGVRISIARLIRYALITASLFLVLWVLGFAFTKLVILISALGVGIGFGLQSIVNNFISGLILLFERPIRVGDSLEFDGKWVDVKKIGLRATTVRTLDQADVIVPNADLVTNAVTNWTLGNRQVRISIPVGVAYGSDTSLTMQTLLESAKANPRVAKNPIPQVIFFNFGESSLELELRVYINNADERLQIRSELLEQINKLFIEKNIEIAFPQRDLHIKTGQESILLSSQEEGKPNA